MTKNEIQNGMYVKLRNGDLRLKVGNKLIDANGKWNEFDYYDDNLLTHGMDKKWDIIEIFVPSSPDLFKESALERVWVRPHQDIEIGDMFKTQDGNVVVMNICDSKFYPYECIRFEEGKDSLDFEPFDFSEISKFTYIRNVKEFNTIAKILQGLIDGTI